MTDTFICIGHADDIKKKKKKRKKHRKKTPTKEELTEESIAVAEEAAVAVAPPATALPAAEASGKKSKPKGRQEVTHTPEAVTAREDIMGAAQHFKTPEELCHWGLLLRQSGLSFEQIIKAYKEARLVIDTFEKQRLAEFDASTKTPGHIQRVSRLLQEFVVSQSELLCKQILPEGPPADSLQPSFHRLHKYTQ